MKESIINRCIGKNIANLRESMGYKQEAFADELNKILKKQYKIENANYDYKTISNWENGKSIPKMEVLIAICKEYNLSLDELLKDKINDIVSKSSFADSDEKILNKFIENPCVCVNKNGKYESAFNPEMYKYGQLSYLADNLVQYRSSMSKNFSFTSPIKKVEILTGIMDVSDNKRELHILGNGENDIVSVENVPSYYSLTVNNNSVIDGIMYNELTNRNTDRIVKLGNGKTYVLKGSDMSDYDSNMFKFEEDNIPEDLDFYELNSKDWDWTDYGWLKSNYIIDENQLLDEYGGGVTYYKKSSILEFWVVGTIKVTDNQLIKVLADDYKHRLVQELAKISDDSICEMYEDEVGKYRDEGDEE